MLGMNRLERTMMKSIKAIFDLTKYQPLAKQINY